MKKPYLLPVAALVLMVLMGFAIFIGAKSFTVPIQSADQNACVQAAKQAGNKKPDCPSQETVWDRGLRDPVAYYTLWITWFTGVLAGLGIFQGWLTFQQIRLARSEFEASHPPELVMRDVRWESIESDSARIAFTLANRGGSTATIVESIFRVRSSLNRTETMDADGANELPISLAPGEFKACNTPMMSEGEMTIAAGAAMAIFSDLWFRGVIIYASPSGVRRRMVFTRENTKGSLHFHGMNEPELDYTD